MSERTGTTVAERNVAALEAELAELRERHARDARAYEALSRRVGELEDALGRAQEAAARHERIAAEQQREALRAASLLGQVLRSRSWRITAPLREGIEPLKRFLGRLRGGAAAAPEQGDAGLAPGPRHRAVLLVSGCPGDARRYRCDHARERLEGLGLTADVVLYGEAELAPRVPSYALFVLHRVPYGPDVEDFLHAAKRAGKPVLFDTDDWVFDLAATEHVAALAEMSADEPALYRDGLTRYRATLARCDGALVSTEPLRARALELLENVQVVPNVASRTMVELSRRARERRALLRHAAATADARGDDAAAAAGRAVVLAYLSGTPTHRRDFAQAVPALAHVLDTHPEASLLLVGHIAVPDELARFAARIAHRPLVPWQELPGILAGVDVNLAPLETGNAFTECKSSIKFLEAALVGVPTVATPLPDFRRVIDAGRNGLLATADDEWRRALDALLGAPSLRGAIGEAALADAEGAQTTARGGEAYLEKLRTAARLARPDGPLTINWIVRAPIAGTGGGYWTIFRLANALGRAGHRVRVYVEPVAHLEGRTRAEIEHFCGDAFGPLSVEIAVGHDAIAPADVSIATNWPTAYTVARLPGSPSKLYFIQDFEPDFYAPEDPLHAQAEDTYALPLGHVTIGRSLARRMGETTGRACASIDFAIDADVFHVTVPPEARPGPVRVLFFARPSLPRRGYGIGLAALRRLKRERPDVRIAFFGSTDAELGPVDFSIENLGVLTHAELAREMNESHVLLCFSLSANISWVPFQGMACGCAVVDADVPGVREMVENGRTCALAPPEADAVADVLRGLVDDGARRTALATAAADAMRARTFAASEAQFAALLRERCLVPLGRDDGTRS